MDKSSKNALSMYGLEVALGLSDLLLVLMNKYTFGSDSLIIKGLSIMYVVATFIIMFTITTRLSSNKAEQLEKQEDYSMLVVSTTKLAAEKRMPDTANTINVQARKLEDRARLVGEMLKNHFSEDSTCGEVAALVDKYKDTFYDNLERINTRLTIFDNSNPNTNLKVDNALKAEAMEVYNSHVNYISDKVNTNEKIIIELDKLLTELTRINDSVGVNSLDQLQDYTAALKQINDNESEEDEQMKKLMSRY